MNQKHQIEGKEAMNQKEYGGRLREVFRLSVPAILAEVSSIIMQYIDTAMVGSLGAGASAAIGLVSSSTWLIGGTCISIAMGFSVQVSHLIGAEREQEARNVLRQSLVVSMLFAVAFGLFGAAISKALPVWLQGSPEIRRAASVYFLIYACTLPAIQLRQLGGSMLQCSGDMRIAGILNASMCALDVVFNALLIFPSRRWMAGGLEIRIPGADLGVAGAALGTALSELVIALLMLLMVCVRSKKLHLIRRAGETKHWRPEKFCLKKALSISLPMAFEHIVLCGAQVTTTRIVAPLGTVAVAANSLAVTAESFCYMPGYGIASAATALVGQRVGAKDREGARFYARASVLLGVLMMTVTGALMFFAAPLAFQVLTPDPQVQYMGVQVLRIEMLAEPFFAMSIVAAGALRGAGDTLIPSLMNFVSMWGARITLSLLLTPFFGLTGVWIAMCAELVIRGLLFLYWLLKEQWLHRAFEK